MVRGTAPRPELPGTVNTSLKDNGTWQPFYFKQGEQILQRCTVRTVYTQVHHYNLLAIYCVLPCYSELCVLTEEEEGHQKAGKVCEGDSGGPLIVRVRHFRLYLRFFSLYFELVFFWTLSFSSEFFFIFIFIFFFFLPPGHIISGAGVVSGTPHPAV